MVPSRVRPPRRVVAALRRTPARLYWGGGPRRVEARLARIARRVGGTVGVAAHHLESGRELRVDGAARFPMASTMKVALGVFVRGSSRSVMDQNRVIAQLARAVYDYFVARPA